MYGFFPKGTEETITQICRLGWTLVLEMARGREEADGLIRSEGREFKSQPLTGTLNLNWPKISQ